MPAQAKMPMSQQTERQERVVALSINPTPGCCFKAAVLETPMLSEKQGTSWDASLWSEVFNKEND